MSFHEVRFPTDISLGAQGGPERKTDIVVLGSGHEERNTRWADARRRYNAGYGVKRLDDLYQIIAFFEERRGQLYGFRWKDATDFTSSTPQSAPTLLDQQIGIGDGVQADFQLIKVYGENFAPYTRTIQKPVAGTVLVAVDGVSQTESSDFTVDEVTGVVTFLPGHIPASGQVVAAGFEFDVPVRFETDRLEINLAHFQAGQIPNIPLVEVRV